MQGTFTVAGQRVRTSSQRRFVAFIVTYHPSPDHGITRGPVRDVRVWGRSDSEQGIRARVQRQGVGSGWRFVIVDTVTGETI